MRANVGKSFLLDVSRWVQNCLLGEEIGGVRIGQLVPEALSQQKLKLT